MKLRRKRIIKVKTKKIVNSFKYAFEGFLSAFQTERNMKIHITIMILVILMGILLKISCSEWIVCIILFSTVIAGELFNTALEKTVDIAMPYKNEKAKIAKDISASGVLVLAIGAAIIGLIIFIPKILNLIIY
ncbi:MAG: diacylglycerol kinase family protein [Clostridia bacterium]